MSVKFGPAGNSDLFYRQGHKSSSEAPEWIHNMGLDAYEYPCSRGVNIGEERAKEIGRNAKKFNIEVSIHAPYYINLASQEKQKLENSIDYIVNSAKVAQWMGAKVVVVHPGSCAKIDRSLAMDTAKKTLRRALDALKDMQLDDVLVCPETMGKKNQLGSMDEIMELCSIDERIIPTIDFGHVNALGQGCLKNKDDYRRVLDTIKDRLGEYRLKNIHCHFSRIEYTKAGEKKHWTLADTQFGPEFDPLAELLIEYDMCSVIICESMKTMAEDALKLKTIYESMLHKK
ncbi:MAG TPA: endonuclease IV [Clostridiaceae bacterium]|nr:endonuclease IV [Clostridiaceae bacterium]